MIDADDLGELFRQKPRLALDRHMSLIRLRVAELKASPEAARWRKNPDGTVYRGDTEISLALWKASEDLDFEKSLECHIPGCECRKVAK